MRSARTCARRCGRSSSGRCRPPCPAGSRTVHMASAVERVYEDIGRRARNNLITARLIQMLQAFDAIQGRGGLVQRSTASAVLANMYLGRLRYVLSDYIDRHSPRFLSALGGMFNPVPLPSVFLMRSGWLQPAWWGYPWARRRGSRA